MTQFITDPATVYTLIFYGAFVSIGCAVLAYLWQLEKDEAEKAEGAAKFFEDCRDVMVVRFEDLKAANKNLADTNAHLSDILSRAYVRNKYGILQAYQDWAINGDKKPKPRKTQEQKIKERKPMTRAEYVRALLTEAAESDEFKNEVWPKSALEQMDDVSCNRCGVDCFDGLQLALITFGSWAFTKEGTEYWRSIAGSKTVLNFKPKTQWVK